MPSWLLPLSLGTLVVSECPLTQYPCLHSKHYERLIFGSFILLCGLHRTGYFSDDSIMTLAGLLALQYYSFNARQWLNTRIIERGRIVDSFALVLIMIMTYQLWQIATVLKPSPLYA